MQFVVFQKITSAYLFQIAREKSCDYLLIIDMKKISRQRGEVLLLRLNVTVQSAKELIRFCACELIICGVTALEAEGPDEPPATGMGFDVLFPFEIAHESCHCSSSSASS